MKKWRCLVCGYEFESEEENPVCPVCGVGKEDLEEIEEESK